MKPLSSKSIGNFLTNSGIPTKPICQIAQFSTSPTQFHHNSHSFSPYSSRRQEDESRLLRVSVWWDFENCNLPAGTNVFKVAQNVTAAVRSNGIKGPIQITAFGDVLQLSRSNQEALSSTGINLTHVPRGGKNSADRSLLVDLMYWVSQNPPPAHLFLISSDRDFASILHRLRLNNYNILLSSLDNTPGVLCSAATVMWRWHSLLRGENLCGKHFNQPPDGPYASWYGGYKFPLEDPFAVNTQPASCPQVDGLSESVLEPKLRPVPKTVVKQIRHIVNSYPEGISITDLRSELGKTNVNLDKDLYGYKKFSCFLLSNSHILKIQSCGESQLSIRSIAPTIPDSAVQTPSITKGPLTNNECINQDISGKRNASESSCTGLQEKVSSPTASNGNAKEPLRNLLESPKQVEESVNKVPNTLALVEKANSVEVVSEPLIMSKGSAKSGEEPPVTSPPLVAEKAKNADITMSDVHSLEEQNPISEVGFFKTIWRKLFGGKYGGSSNSSTEIKENKKNCVDSTSQCIDPVDLASMSSSPNQAITDKYGARRSEATDEGSTRGSGLFKQIVEWCRSLNGPKSDNFNKLSSDNMSKSKDEKWVEEYPCQNGPSKLNMPAEKSCSSDSQNRNMLKSIFVDTQLQPESPKLPEHCEDENVPRVGLSPPLDHKTTCQSRDQILHDCQKLVDDIVKKYPEGVHMSCFKKLFLETYDYSLDVHKLGYLKLSNLLQIMAGVKIESNCIIPDIRPGKVWRSSDIKFTYPSVPEFNYNSTTAKSDNYLSRTSSKSQKPDSMWEKLVPIPSETPKRNEIKRSNRTLKNVIRQVNHDYESLTDGDSYYSDEESLTIVGSKGQVQPRINPKDSSLLRILDSWHISNEDCNSRIVSQNVDEMVDGSGKDLLPPSCGVGIQNEFPVGNYGHKQRSDKGYSFVAEPRLGGSKKPTAESRVPA